MRPSLYSLGILLVTTLCISSCRDNYYIENDMHGMWQVMSVERFSTGEVTESQGKLYYSFQRTMVMLSDIDLEIPNRLKRYIAHFDLVAPDSIGMGYFRIRTTGEGDLVEQEDTVELETLNKFGIYQNYTTFHMAQNKQKLVLTSDSACLVLRKY